MLHSLIRWLHARLLSAMSVPLAQTYLCTVCDRVGYGRGLPCAPRHGDMIVNLKAARELERRSLRWLLRSRGAGYTTERPLAQACRAVHEPDNAPLFLTHLEEPSWHARGGS